METEKSKFKLPEIFRSANKSRLVGKFSQPSSLSPTLPSLERSLKILPIRKVQSPTFANLPKKSKLTKLPTKLLNPSSYLRKINESPIKAKERKESIDEDFNPIFSELDMHL